MDQGVTIAFSRTIYLVNLYEVIDCGQRKSKD